MNPSSSLPLVKSLYSFRSSLMYTSILSAFLATAALITLAHAHGVVYQIKVAGQTFNAPLIGAASSNSGPIYVPSSNSPVTDLTSDDLFCGSIAATATTTPTIDLSEGNSISFYWNSGYSEGTDWPHNTGPMFLYIAQCNGDCTSQTPSNTQFVKIEQQGFAANGEWAQASVASGSPATFTIPSDFASGTYLLRHEIINLANTLENYPSCSQFTISGGSNTYSSAEKVTFPGAYSASDPGLADAGSPIYSVKSNAAYVFPGPEPILADGTSSSGSPSSGSPSSGSPSSGSPSSAASSSGASSTPSSDTLRCTLSRRVVSS